MWLFFSTKTLKWTVKSEDGHAPWDRRADHASAISHDGAWLFIFGGQHEKEGGRYWTRLSDTWRVPLPSAHASEWQRLGDVAAPRSSPSVMTLPTGWLITLGGHWTPDMETLQTVQSDEEGMKKHHATNQACTRFSSLE